MAQMTTIKLMAVQSQVGDIKIVSTIRSFVLNTLTLNQGALMEGN